MGKSNRPTFDALYCQIVMAKIEKVGCANECANECANDCKMNVKKAHGTQRIMPEQKVKTPGNEGTIGWVIYGKKHGKKARQ